MGFNFLDYGRGSSRIEIFVSDDSMKLTQNYEVWYPFHMRKGNTVVKLRLAIARWYIQKYETGYAQLCKGKVKFTYEASDPPDRILTCFW